MEDRQELPERWRPYRVGDRRPVLRGRAGCALRFDAHFAGAGCTYRAFRIPLGWAPPHRTQRRHDTSSLPDDDVPHQLERATEVSYWRLQAGTRPTTSDDPRPSPAQDSRQQSPSPHRRATSRYTPSTATAEHWAYQDRGEPNRTRPDGLQTHCRHAACHASGVEREHSCTVSVSGVPSGAVVRVAPVLFVCDSIPA